MNGLAAVRTWLGDVLQDAAVAHLQLDSRKVCANDVFFSLTIDAQVAQTHIAQAVQQEAAAIVINDELRSVIDCAVPVIPVSQLKENLGAIAHAFYGQPSANCTVIGITGTNGKTSCSHWLAQAWQKTIGHAAFMGTLGCGILNQTQRFETGMTTPDVLTVHRLLAELVQQKANMVAMEVSSHALDQGRVDGVQFDTAIFTNLTRDHLDYHGDMASYAAAKQKLFDVDALQLAIINADDAFGQQLIARVQKNGKPVLSYALENVTSDLGVERYEVTGQGIAASIRTPWGKGELQSRFPGGYNLLNTLAVVATLCGHGIGLEAALQAVAQLEVVPGRTHIVSEKNDDILVVVDYAHTPDALQKVLQALRPQTAKKLWCVFGCGGKRDKGKRPQMAQAVQALADYVVVTTDNPRDEKPEQIIAEIVAGFVATSHKAYEVIVDRDEAIKQVITNASAGDIVLLAGKGHEDYQEILGQRLHFSDVEHAQQALHLRRQQHAGGVA